MPHAHASGFPSPRRGLNENLFPFLLSARGTGMRLTKAERFSRSSDDREGQALALRCLRAWSIARDRPSRYGT